MAAISEISDTPLGLWSTSKDDGVKRRSAGWRLLLTLLIGTSASLPVCLSITLMQLCPPAKPCRGPHWADGGWSATHWGGHPIMSQGWEEDLLTDKDWIVIEPCNFWECLKTQVSGPDLAIWSDASGRLRRMWCDVLRRCLPGENSGICTVLDCCARGTHSFTPSITTTRNALHLYAALWAKSACFSNLYALRLSPSLPLLLFLSFILITCSVVKMTRLEHCDHYTLILLLINKPEDFGKTIRIRPSASLQGS